MFGQTITIASGDKMSEAERVARCICRATHGTSEHWELYEPAAIAVLSQFRVDTDHSGYVRSGCGGLLG
jgi:hypothetical protein